MFASTTIERERSVILVRDIRGALDPQPMHGMASDVHAEDVGGVLSDLPSGPGQFDAAGLSTATDLHLGFDDNWILHPIRLGARHVNRVSHDTRRHSNPKAGEVRFALVLEEIHPPGML